MSDAAARALAEAEREAFEAKTERNRFATAIESLAPLVGLSFDRRVTAEEAEKVSSEVAALVHHLNAEVAYLQSCLR